MSWNNIKLIYLRELRDQLRDRRTLFTVLVLPLLLYPLMGMLRFQVQQFVKERASQVRIIGTGGPPRRPGLFDGDKLAAEYGEASGLELELIPKCPLALDE